MSVALVALVLATQALSGWLVLRALAPDLSGRWTTALPRALLLGPLVLTLQMLACDAAGVPLRLPALLLPWWALAGLAAWRRRGRPAAEREPLGPAHLAALGLAFALGGLALGAGLLQPLRAGDPLTNAALSGRVAATLGSLDADRILALQAPVFASYPPLVAFNEAALFRAAGEGWARAAMPFFALAQLALLLLLVETCFERARPARALPLALLLLLAPTVATGGATGYFDERFAASVLLLGLTLSDLHRRPGAPRALLAAAAAVACALTKPQGLVVAAVAALLLAASLARGRLPVRAALAALGLLAAGCALWPVFAHARGLDPPPELVPHWPGAASLAARMAEALTFAARQALPLDAAAWSAWGLAWPALLALGAVGLARRSTRALAGMALLAGALQLAGYVAMVACISIDFEWSLATGLGRWLLHLLPWAALAAAAAIEEPAA